MSTHRSNPLQASRLRPLAACLAIVFSAEILAAPSGPAVGPVPADVTPRVEHRSPWADSALRAVLEKSGGSSPSQPDTLLTVQNCNDAGANSLRDVVDAANMLSGDVTIQFDMNAMNCSTITLTSGEIGITRDALTLQGPGADLLTIDGDYLEHHYNRIFNHSGPGTLTIVGLTLTDAKYVSDTHQASGGCIYSNGTVDLHGTTIKGCRVGVGGAPVQQLLSAGGGVWARNVALARSTVSDCRALSLYGAAQGGGLFAANGSMSAKYSTIDNNLAHSYSPSHSGVGGGILSLAPAYIDHSTISANKAERAGGLYGTHAVTIVGSTISGNEAKDGGVNVHTHVSIYNSTIAFNKGTENSGIGGIEAASFQSYSSIFAYNTYYQYGTGQVEADVKSDDGMITGAKNLIIAASANTTPPADTSPACPRLAPLLDNGGATRTHALLPGSPAIDAGDNVKNLTTDQRGTGYDRLVGAFPDIGAFEWAEGSGDVISMSGFEDCGP